MSQAKFTQYSICSIQLIKDFKHRKNWEGVLEHGE